VLRCRRYHREREKVEQALLDPRRCRALRDRQAVRGLIIGTFRADDPLIRDDRDLPDRHEVATHPAPRASPGLSKCRERHVRARAPPTRADVWSSGGATYWR
jgi:hypothetical protein